MELATLVGNNLVNAISDRSYDTRLSAATEIEKALARSIRDSNAASFDIIAAVKTEYLSRANANSRKGGLMLLGCIVVGPGRILSFAGRRDAIQEAFKLLDDDDSSVRFAACECLYNSMASVVLDGEIFKTLFDALCKIESDPEIQASAVSFDRCLRELVMSCKSDVETTVFVTVESRVLYPHSFVKQLSLGWFRFLRAHFSSSFATRLAKALPALISTLSHSSSRDVEISVDAFLCQILADIESGLLPISLESVDQVSAVILKYAKFQSTLNIRSRILLFEFFRVLAPSMTSPEICAGTVSAVVMSICTQSTPEDVRSSALRANLAMINCKDFVHSVNQTDGSDLRDLFRGPLISTSNSTTSHITELVRWINCLHPLRTCFSPADYFSITRSLWRTMDEIPRSEIRQVFEIVLIEFKDSLDSVGKDLAKLYVSVGYDAEYWQYTLKIVRDSNETLFADVIKSVANFLRGEVMANQILLSVVSVLVSADDTLVGKIVLDKEFISVLKDVCPIGFLLVCIGANEYGQALEAFKDWHKTARSFDADSLDVFVAVFESDSFYAQRISLVRAEGRLLAEILMNVLLVSPVDSRASKLIGSRLQLAGFSRCT